MSVLVECCRSFLPSHFFPLVLHSGESSLLQLHSSLTSELQHTDESEPSSSSQQSKTGLLLLEDMDSIMYVQFSQLTIMTA